MPVPVWGVWGQGLQVWGPEGRGSWRSGTAQAAVAMAAAMELRAGRSNPPLLLLRRRRWLRQRRLIGRSSGRVTFRGMTLPPPPHT